MGFYIWWLCINGCLFFAEVHFIEDFAGIRAKRFMVPYVLLGVLLTYGVMYAQSGGVLRFVLHTGIILCFSVFVLKISWRLAIAPAAIIMTLFTFMEGFQTVLLRWLSGQTVKRGMAIFLQMAVSGVLVFLLAVTLKFISKKYAGIGRQKISAYLFTLLLPCAFIVWVIRSGLGLDMWLESGLENGFFEKRPGLWAMAWLLGACAVFFIILKLLGNIITLSMKEAEQEGMKEQVQRQRIYLAEAKKRNERYRRFQHDINNHFLVLSGLLHEKKYDEAGKYFDGLHGISDGLLVGIETGNPVADILLNEKISYARSNGITVSHDVHFPAECSIEDIDLCVILANGVDNAIQACLKGAQEQPEISIRVRTRYHFLVLEIENTLPYRAEPAGDRLGRYMQQEGRKPVYGTGLKNIEHTVEKYEGTMEIESGKDRFLLTMLLCMKPFTKGE